MLLIAPVLGFGQTPITDANFNQAIETCLSTNPIDGMCSDSEYGAMPDWDVSQVTNMYGAFMNRNDFNADISAWDMSRVTTMRYMFFEASAFNKPIGDWYASNLTNMRYMFGGASSFNQPIGNWDVSSVSNMSAMFYEASAFNQDISNWCVTKITQQPNSFSIGSPLIESNKPIWGTCPPSPYRWINYGTQDWTVENAEIETYRDGTPIPQVTEFHWGSLTYGAWCYWNNDPKKPKVYNWYAVAGIHDRDPNTPNKEFAPEGWHVPSDAEWTTLEEHLIANGYNYDGTTTGNKIAKSMASTTGWESSTRPGGAGNDQNLNNSSGFNAFPKGYVHSQGAPYGEGNNAKFWSSTELSNDNAYYRTINNNIYLQRLNDRKRYGFSVRFVRQASTASTNNYSNAITIYPNPTTSILTIEGNKEYYVEVYDMAGNKLMALTGNSINMEHLSTATYIVKATDKSNNEELTYKVVKN